MNLCCFYFYSIVSILSAFHSRCMGARAHTQTHTHARSRGREVLAPKLLEELSHNAGKHKEKRGWRDRQVYTSIQYASLSFIFLMGHEGLTFRRRTRACTAQLGVSHSYSESGCNNVLDQEHLHVALLGQGLGGALLFWAELLTPCWFSVRWQ